MDEPVEKLPAVSALVQNTNANIDGQLLILLEDFDALIGTAAHNFPVAFFTDLNALKGTRNITLCCVTEKTHKNSLLFFEGGRTQRTSFLDLEPIDIPPLQMREIRDLLHRRLTNCEHWQKEAHKERFVDVISKAENPMVFIDLIIDDFFYNKDRFEKRIKRCKKQYKKRYKKNHHNWMKKWTWKSIKAELKDIIGIGKSAKELSK